LSNYYKAHVLIVEDDEMSVSIISEAISGFYHLETVRTGDAALEFCKKTLPDLILMDIEMPSMDGLTACKILKRQGSTRYIPVVIITAHTELIYEDLSWEAGCADFIGKPFSPIALRHRINHHLEVKLLTDKFKRLASIDGLTGLQNRHAFNQYLAEQTRLSLRMKRPLGLLMIDIDLFKEFNDNYGHLGGDDCLQQIAIAMSESLVRPTDHIARYGGEEFVVLLPDTCIEGAEIVANKILRTVQDLAIPHQSSPEEILTISIGVTSCSAPDIDKDSLIHKADVLLYKAKNDGRNRVVVSA
jgi:diguanylate cyclase (GGDEF)-like protein